MPDIRVVVGLDFGTTYSGFTYCHLEDNDHKTNERWPNASDSYKIHTVLKYDERLNNVESWGQSALSRRPDRRVAVNKKDNVVELFKLHLGNLNDALKEKYSLSVDYKKAITDYLREIGKHIKDTVTVAWEIDFMENVLLVLTVPAEYTQKEKAIMRECACNAGLINEIDSKKLEFTTEPEAAAIYCKDNVLREHDLATSGTIFMIVDCGGGTVDLTTRKLLNENQLGEITERAGDYCGSSFIDDAFLDHLKTILNDRDNRPMDLLRNEYYGQMQYMVQEFCQNVKFEFTGEDLTFNYEMDLNEVSPVIAQYVSDEVRQRMEETEWLIKLDYETIKSMFDPVVERILRMIRVQLENCHEKGSQCSAMLLVGGFSQSEYLQKRIKDEFLDNTDHPGINISVPTNPVAAVSRGAAIYGVSFANVINDMNDDEMDGLMFVIDSRVLRYTYGIKVLNPGDSAFSFHPIARKGVTARINDEFTAKVRPTLPFQKTGVFEIYFINKYEANLDDPEMRILGKLKIDWPDKHLGINRPTTFKLTFGRMEITAKASNDINGQNYHTSFEVDLED
ncbi:actin-like ATPase domain-containing protein [Rhizophagus irregularis]|uniref:Actin-like ATPase domain-containing protein n=1 Tax=Rhizophagus irregularis TaxID=588596 RepID=A0A2N0P822_9GLOM|nr:actin-like ATPase domain-containing protein [Rhizophagus irregularis]